MININPDFVEFLICLTIAIITGIAMFGMGWVILAFGILSGKVKELAYRIKWWFKETGMRGSH